MTEALRLSFDIACDAEHAFAVWTERFATWWPNGHTVSGDPKAEVRLEHLGLVELEHNPRNNRVRAK